MNVEDRDFRGAASGNRAVEELGAIAREREKTKRVLIGAACIFVIVAALIMMFAPADKEKLGYIIGAALVVMALGAIGAAQFRFKAPGGIEVDTRPQRAAPRSRVPVGQSSSDDDDIGPR